LYTALRSTRPTPNFVTCAVSEGHQIFSSAIKFTIMAPKHSLQAEETLAKRVKNYSTPSATPSNITAEVPFSVKHRPAYTKRKLTEEEQELVDHAEFHTLPFLTLELDQYYTVTPSAEWN
jgi:hypothetical protein